VAALAVVNNSQTNRQALAQNVGHKQKRRGGAFPSAEADRYSRESTGVSKRTSFRDKRLEIESKKLDLLMQMVAKGGNSQGNAITQEENLRVSNNENVVSGNVNTQEEKMRILRFMTGIQETHERKALKKFRREEPTDFGDAFRLYMSKDMTNTEVKNCLLEDCNYVPPELQEE